MDLLSLIDFFLNLAIVVLFCFVLSPKSLPLPHCLIKSEHTLDPSFGLSGGSAKCLKCLARSLHFGLAAIARSSSISPISGKFLSLSHLEPAVYQAT